MLNSVPRGNRLGGGSTNAMSNSGTWAASETTISRPESLNLGSQGDACRGAQATASLDDEGATPNIDAVFYRRVHTSVQNLTP